MASDNRAFVNTDESDPDIGVRREVGHVVTSGDINGEATTPPTDQTHLSGSKSVKHISDELLIVDGDADKETSTGPSVVSNSTSKEENDKSAFEEDKHVIYNDNNAKHEINSVVFLKTSDLPSKVSGSNVVIPNGISSAEKGVEGTISPYTKGTAPVDGEPSYPPGEERRMLRNVVMVGVVFMVHFTATLGATNLQSSVNAAQGLGTSALAAQYVGLVISSLLLSVFIIEKLGCKWTIALAILANLPYMAAQLYTRVYTLVPGALLMGLAVAPLWSAKCTYLCVISEAHAEFTASSVKATRDKAIGIFFMIFLFSIVWGNLISSVVLSVGNSVDKISNWTVDSGAVCGANFCPGSEEATSNPNLERPAEEKIQVIIGIYLACIVLASLICIFGVDSLKRYREGKRTSSGSGLSTLRLLTVTLELHKQRDMLLMIPLSLWLGVDYGFVEAEYTASFVACAWGISNIGYVIICYGLANSALALLTGWLVARAGRRPVLCVAAVLHAALMAALLAWRPSADHKPLFFVGAALWGAADGHWAVQINSLYAILFPGKEEAAYSNFRLWQSIGFIVAFSYSHHLCTDAKLYIVLALLVAGVAGYLGIEYTRPRKVNVS